MIREVSDADVLAFMRAGCNTEELAAFAGCTIAFASGWMAHVLRLGEYVRLAADPVPEAEHYDRHERGYVEMACERISRAQDQRTLLPPEPARECVQAGLL